MINDFRIEQASVDITLYTKKYALEAKNMWQTQKDREKQKQKENFVRKMKMNLHVYKALMFGKLV